MRRKPFCILFLAGFAQAVKNVLDFFTPMSAWPDPEPVKIIRPHKDRYYSKGWVAELITAGIATEHRQAELIGSSRSVWCQACTSCHCIVCCMVKVFLSIHQYDFDEWSFGYTEVANIYEYPWACNDRSKHIIYPSLEHSALLFLLDIDKKSM